LGQKEEEITEGRKAGRASKTSPSPSPSLSSRSGSATVKDLSSITEFVFDSVTKFGRDFFLHTVRVGKRKTALRSSPLLLS